MEIDGLIIPDKWLEIMQLIAKYSNNCFLAGGAIRDLSWSKPVKDLDFFVSEFQQDEMEIDLNLMGSNIDYRGMKYIQVAFSCIIQGIDINILVIDHVDMQTLLRRFDFGLCQIGFDGNTIHKTQEYLWDAKYNIMTLYDTSRYSRSIKRYMRLYEKYPYPISIPILDQVNQLGEQNNAEP